MAARELTTRRRPTLGLRGVPVLMYHGLLSTGEHAHDGRDAKYWLPEELFRGHLALLAREGRHPTSLRDLWDGAESPQDPASVVALTFDDGRASDYEVAYPALTEAGARADFFVNTATVGQPGFLTWPQISEMQRAGLTFQSHSHDHVALLWLPPPQLERQIHDSKRMLEDRVGSPVDFLAVPYGLVNRRVTEMARRVGYRAVCNSLSWLARPGSSRVHRIAVYGDTSPSALTRLLRGHGLAFAGRVARATAVYFPKRVLLRVQPARLGVRILETGA
jgi:peptidoglycan/xylan/chitin deacetylase (PgdA/CDA1 family)